MVGASASDVHQDLCRLGVNMTDEIIKILLTHLTASNVLLVIITIGIYKIYDKVKIFDSRVANIEKKQSKMVMIMEQCPSIAKENVAWLSNDRKNTRPPVKSLCTMPHKGSVK